MKKILAVLCVLVAITSCKASSNPSTKGNKKITSVEKSVTPYSEISVAGSCDIIYEQKSNQKPYLRIEIDDNLQQYVKAQVKNGVLQVSLDGRNIQPSKFRAYTNSASLTKVRIAGSGDVTLKNEVKSPTLNISIAGSGDLTAENLLCNDFSISIAGSGDAQLRGKATNSNISISGSGDIDAGNLVTKNTICSIQGSGGARVYATEELTAKISGSGDIRFKGNPIKLNKTVRGSGSISSF